MTQRQTKIVFSHVVRELVNSHYPKAEIIALVRDNLNTHKLASLYEAFEPAESLRLIERSEIHYTPKHGNWLDMAETELSILTKRSLDRRIPDHPPLIRKVAAWENQRNESKSTADWRYANVCEGKFQFRLRQDIPVNPAVLTH